MIYRYVDLVSRPKSPKKKEKREKEHACHVNLSDFACEQIM